MHHFYFNSHAREGRDLLFKGKWYLLFYFNSHAREGRDMLVFELVYKFQISTHTPVKGVTFVNFN